MESMSGRRLHCTLEMTVLFRPARARRMTPTPPTPPIHPLTSNIPPHAPGCVNACERFSYLGRQ